MLVSCIHYYISNLITKIATIDIVFVKSSNTYCNKQTFLFDKKNFNKLDKLRCLDRQHKDENLKGKYYNLKKNI